MLNKNIIINDLERVVRNTEKESYVSTDAVSLAEQKGYKMALLDVVSYISFEGGNCNIIERTRWQEFLKHINRY